MFDEKKYLLNSKLSSFKRKVQNSKEIIHQAMKKCKNPYIACSGGKDSVALSHLIINECGYKDTLVFIEKDDCDFPDEKPYVKHLIQEYKWNAEIIEPEQSMWEYLITNVKDLDRDIHKKSHEITKIFFLECIKKFVDKYNPDCVFMGLRNQESRARRINYYMRGDTYKTKYDDEITHCNPLSLWNVDDVFSYMVSKEVPILPLYKKVSSIRQAEEIRKSWWIPSAEQIQFGYVGFLKKEYPELYRRLTKYYPEVAGAC